MQAERFRLNVNIDLRRKDLSKLLVSLGGHGKNGELTCNDVRCPLYDEMVTMNDGKSFQTGCGFDPVQTGCCFQYSKKESNSDSYTCFKCQEEYVEVTETHVACKDDKILSWNFQQIKDIPLTFRDDDGFPQFCGKRHNPGAIEMDYFLSSLPNVGPQFSNNNWNSSFISDIFLCNRYEWEQGDFIDDAGLHNEEGIGSDFGLSFGRHTRMNFNNYIQDKETKRWSIGSMIEGKYGCDIFFYMYYVHF